MISFAKTGHRRYTLILCAINTFLGNRDFEERKHYTTEQESLNGVAHFIQLS